VVSLACSKTISQTFITVVSGFTLFIADVLIAVIELCTRSSAISKIARVRIRSVIAVVRCKTYVNFISITSSVVHTLNSVLSYVASANTHQVRGRSKSFKMCDFLLVVRCKYSSILYRFRVI